MIYRTSIRAYDGALLTLAPESDLTADLARTRATQAEIRILDPRCLSTEQRGKVFALCTEITEWSSDSRYEEEVEYMRKYLMRRYCDDNGLEYFSLSNVDMATCTGFISFLIDFCLFHGVPTGYPLIDKAEDISRFLYGCLYHRRCAVRGKDAETHHLDAVGMGRDREHIVHIGLRAMALCRKHHDEVHKVGLRFYIKNHVHGIKFDKRLCDRLRLNTEEM